MSERLLLCTDLDRTILPNGRHPESARARPLFRAFAERDAVSLAYVSGRDETLIRDAIRRWDLPVPHHAIGDVGSSLFEVHGDRFARVAAWDDAIAEDWGGRTGAELADALEWIDQLEPQEDEKQARFKLSFYVNLDADRDDLVRAVGEKLEAKGIRSNLVWSVDEEREIGLLDVLPHRAGKLHAVRFLGDRLGVRSDRTVFAGDSGNDIDALVGGFPAVLVANASEEVRREALDRAEHDSSPERLYIARGGFLGMNGNYSAGVLEGLAHHLDDARRDLEILSGTVE
jgi:HAD superfamily hydrolase (TIGR01484 family)